MSPLHQSIASLKEYRLELLFKINQAPTDSQTSLQADLIRLDGVLTNLELLSQSSLKGREQEIRRMIEESHDGDRLKVNSNDEILLAIRICRELGRSVHLRIRD